MQEVCLDTRRKKGSSPFEDGWDCEARRLAGLGRPDHQNRVPRLSGDKTSPVGSEHEAIARRVRDSQRPQVARACPPTRLPLWFRHKSPGATVVRASWRVAP